MKKTATPSETNDGILTSGDHLSYWTASGNKPLAFTKLDRNISTDILVIGGGISGLTTAYCLIKEGRQVVLVEDGHLGSGESGRTTAHITSALDDRYFELENTFDEPTARLAASSHMAAIEWIATIIEQEKIECHFRRVSGYLFSHPSDNEQNLQKEYEATKRAGLDTEMLPVTPFLVTRQGRQCLKFNNQAQFHILLYLEGLANAFITNGGQIYTETKAENITKTGAEANGYKIEANHIVVATNTPINDLVTMHTKQWPYRTYVIAAKIPKGTLPYALWWDTGDANSGWLTKPYHYVRLEAFDDRFDLLISGGEDHRTGQADDEGIKEEARYARLEAWTKQHFPSITTIAFRWSGQVMEPLDSLAYIGKNPGDDNIYIITGDSGNGMTHGTLGGMLLKDLITGVENPWTALYNPSRITFKTTGDYLMEIGNMIAQFGDWFTPEHLKEVSELPPGEGGILTSGIKKIAVYRDNENLLHSFSAVCPHLGGIVQWNADEKTFDCPMHGSRFTCLGKTINGPAIADLKAVKEEDDNLGLLDC